MENSTRRSLLITVTVALLSSLLLLSGLCGCGDSDSGGNDASGQPSEGAASMLRITYVMNRIPGLSRSDFQDYWRYEHAPLVQQHADLLGIQGYTQLHTLGNPIFNRMMRLVRNTAEPYDGTEAFWVDRSTLAAALETPSGQRAMEELVEDERRFVDTANSSLWLAAEHVIVRDGYEPKSTPVTKLTWVGSRLPALSPAQFQDHYLNRHAPLVKSYASYLGIHDYVQNHWVADPLNETLRDMRGTMAPYYVHAEFIWNFAEMVSLSNVQTARQAMKEIAEDEKRFIDFPTSAIWVAREHVIIPPPRQEAPPD